MTDLLATGNFTLIGTSNVTDIILPAQSCLSNVKPSATNGGTAAVGMNDMFFGNVVNSSLITANANEINFSIDELGSYYLKATGPSHQTDNYKLVLTTSDDVVLANGTSEYIEITYGGCVNSIVMTILTVTDVTDEYKIRAYASSAKSTNGWGVQVGAGTDEIYAQLEIMKISD